MPCRKHPDASGRGELCPVCLLEQALEPACVADVTVHMPLGQGAGTSVYLVRQDAPDPALLRLKLWRRPAPASFLEAVTNLTARLEDAAERAIVPPRAAYVDAAGHPVVLSVFRQGLPIAHSVRSGALDPDAARALLDSIGMTLGRCHEAGLAHGAIVPGNVLVQPDGRPAFLVDFGLASVFHSMSHGAAAAADRAGLEALAAALSHSGSRRSSAST